MAWRNALSDARGHCRDARFRRFDQGAEVVFDYAEPFENYPPAMQANLRAVAERTASIGEALAQPVRSA